MKATLHFTLPDEDAEFRHAISGSRAIAVLFDLDQWLRARIKYSGDDVPEDVIEAFEHTREHLRNLCIESNVDIDT